MDAAAGRRRLTRVRPAASRLHAALAPALPLLAIFGGLCLIYAWQAWLNVTPWVVPDEFERAQLSRAIAATGHAAEWTTAPAPFSTLYVYLIAPAWWIRDTAYAYGLVKAIGVVAMTSVCFPAYLLTRMLAPRRWALYAAAGAAVIPALAYSPLLMLETVAYPWAALCFYLVTRVLVTPRLRWLIPAVGACALAPLIRGQLGVILAGAAGAACAFWFTGDGGRRLRRSWTHWHWAGFVVLVTGGVAAADAIAAHYSGVWRFATEQHADDMLRYGLRAFGALTIGVGVLPAVAGLTALVAPRRDRASRERRAFTCTAVAMILGFGLYTAAKAVYIKPTFQPFLLERNLIYVAPLLFAGAAMVFDRGRASIGAAVTATAVAVYAMAITPYRLGQQFTWEAPGLSGLQSLHRNIGLTTGAATTLLIVLALLSGGVLLLMRRARSPAWIGAAAAVALAWSAAGEITYSRASHAWMRSVAANLPQQLDWVDRAVPPGARVDYLGQSIGDPSDVLELEFWNRSVKHVWSLDGTAPGPGPIVVPNVSRDGRLRPGRDVRYVIADQGLSPIGHVLAREVHFGGGQAAKPWTLLRVTQPLRLSQWVEGLMGNGWGRPTTALNEFSIPNDEPSMLRIDVSRHGLDPKLPATVRIRVGKLAVAATRKGPDLEPVTTPVMGKVLFKRTLHVRHNLDHSFVFKAPRPPFRVETSVTPIAPHDIQPAGSRSRTLGAYVGYLVYPKGGR
jgi:hypothetical protein